MYMYVTLFCQLLRIHGFAFIAYAWQLCTRCEFAVGIKTQVDLTDIEKF